MASHLRIGRREFASLAAGAATAGASGCLGVTFSQSVDDDELDGTVLRVLISGRSPSAVDLNRYGRVDHGPVLARLLEQLVLPVHAPTGTVHASGHTWSAGGEEITVPCLVEDYEVDPDSSIELRLDDRLTYWDGTPMDADALWRHERLQWLVERGPTLGDRFPGEVADQWTYRRDISDLWAPNQFGARTRVHPQAGPPVHPSVTTPHVEAIEDAGTESELQTVIEEVTSERVDLSTYIEAGYGSGAYAPENEDDVRSDALVLHRRDDHPGTPAAENVVLRPAEGPRARRILRGRSVDAGTGTIGSDRASYVRSGVPDPIQEVGRFRVPTAGGRQLVFNWGRNHVGRLWVRRALVAALPLGRLAEILFGADDGAPPVHRSGMLSRADERVLGRTFCEALYDYPLAADREIARTWLAEAGYERDGERWIGPDGEALTLTVEMLGGTQADFGRYLRTELESFGVPTTVSTNDIPQYRDALGAGQWDLTIGLPPGGWTPLDFYGAWVVSEPYYTSSGSGPPVEPIVLPPFLPVQGAVSRGRHEDWQLPERVTIPDEPGTLRIGSVDYADGGVEFVYPGNSGRDVALPDRVDQLRDRNADPATLRAAARLCARWHNYALPNVVLVQRIAGLWADVEEFHAPAHEGPTGTSPAEMIPHDHPDPVHYHVQAGTIRPQ